MQTEFKIGSKVSKENYGFQIVDMAITTDYAYVSEFWNGVHVKMHQWKAADWQETVKRYAPQAETR